MSGPPVEGKSIYHFGRLQNWTNWLELVNGRGSEAFASSLKGIYGNHSVYLVCLRHH